MSLLRTILKAEWREREMEKRFREESKTRVARDKIGEGEFLSCTTTYNLLGPYWGGSGIKKPLRLWFLSLICAGSPSLIFILFGCPKVRNSG